MAVTGFLFVCFVLDSLPGFFEILYCDLLCFQVDVEMLCLEFLNCTKDCWLVIVYLSILLISNLNGYSGILFILHEVVYVTCYVFNGKISTKVNYFINPS